MKLVQIFLPTKQCHTNTFSKMYGLRQFCWKKVKGKKTKSVKSKKNHFSNFSCMFLNPDYFFQKLFWPLTVWINCSSYLKNFANSQPSASNFKSFSQSLEHFFHTVGQNIFGDKIPFIFFWHLNFIHSKKKKFSLIKSRFTFLKKIEYKKKNSYDFAKKGI